MRRNLAQFFRNQLLNIQKIQYMAKAKPTKETEEPSISPESILAGELTRNKADHLNFEEEVYYRVSTGSLIMDADLKGGITPGVFVVSGPYETGKTSFTLACMKNMLETQPNSRGFYIKAEGRLSPEMRERSGIKFVFTAEEWVDGTCFVLETNVWEFTLNILRKLVTDNEAKRKYFFFVDSMDGMTLRDDLAKDIGTANKVAGGPLLTKHFLQKLGNAMAKRGHICGLAGQVSANIQLDPYSPNAPRSGPGGGGNAKDHWANYIFVFRPRAQKDLILTDPEGKPDRNNPILGHWVNIQIKKSPNEKSGMPVSYPVRYGRTNGESVWREKEIVDLAMGTFDLITRPTTSSGWVWAESLVEDAKKDGISLKEKIRGLGALYEYVEGDREVFEWLLKKFKRVMGTTQS